MALVKMTFDRDFVELLKSACVCSAQLADSNKAGGDNPTFPPDCLVAE